MSELPNIGDERCDMLQVINIITYGMLMDVFSDKLSKTWEKYVFQTAEIVVEGGFDETKAYEAALEYSRLISEVKETFDGIKAPQDVRKSAYYKILFLTVEKILPAVKEVEKQFGDTVKIDGNLCSDEISFFISNA